MINKNVKLFNIVQLLLVLFLILFDTTNLNAQFKIGNNPKVLSSIALFELEAKTGSISIFTKDSGFWGIGTNNPKHKLEIYNSIPGAFKIVDGTQGKGNYLFSDSLGVATWKVPLNLTSSNGIIVVGGDKATLNNVILRIDSSAIANIVSNNPTKDSIASVVNNLIISGQVYGKNTFSDTFINITNGEGATLNSMSIELDTIALRDFISKSISIKPVKDSLISLNSSYFIYTNISGIIPALSIGDAGSILVNVNGANIGNNVIVNPVSDLPNGVVIAYSRVSATNTVKIGFVGTGSADSFVTSFDIRVFK